MWADDLGCRQSSGGVAAEYIVTVATVLGILIILALGKITILALGKITVMMALGKITVMALGISTMMALGKFVELQCWHLESALVLYSPLQILD